MHRYTSERGIALIKLFEGFSPTVYICSGGYKTIGYGHKILPEENYEYLNQSDAEELLKKDLYKTEKAVIRLISTPLTDNQFDALVSFTFNLGAGALQRSTLRAKLNRGEFDDAADEFPKWCWAGGKKLKGLLRRRMAERRLFLE